IPLPCSPDPLDFPQMARIIADRMISIFTRDGNGRRPVYGGDSRIQNDPQWRDNILFYEYFHGDSGAGLGASHQTGWTGLVAKLLQQCAEYCGTGRSPLAAASEPAVTTNN